jgi:uncharacterized damage-inducible protein DinB
MRPRLTTLVATCGALLLLRATLHAQGAVTRTLQRIEERVSHDLSEAAEEMPADKYGFKPTATQMTFGELVLHIADVNSFLCSAIAATPPPLQRTLLPTASKHQLEERLEESFHLCKEVLEHADDSFLDDSVPFVGGRKITRAAAMIELAADWADHYSQVAMYLRLNGLIPPTAKHKER